MQLKQSPPQPEQAAVFFKQALDYWIKQKAAGKAEISVYDNVITQYMNALLASRQFAEVVRFGGEIVTQEPAKMQSVGNTLATRAESLVASQSPQEALRLIAEARKMVPPLAEAYANRLRDAETDANRQLQATHPPAGRGGAP
jgi:hypothetical protein